MNVRSFDATQADATFTATLVEGRSSSFGARVVLRGDTAAEASTADAGRALYWRDVRDCTALCPSLEKSEASLDECGQSWPDAASVEFIYSALEGGMPAIALLRGQETVVGVPSPPRRQAAGRQGWTPEATTADPEQQRAFSHGEASTVAVDHDEDLYEEVVALCHSAVGEVFEDGMENPFTAGVTRLIQRAGGRGMEPLAHLLVSESMPAEVAAEALRCLGRMEHPLTHSYRRWVLEHRLISVSPLVRDGAALGLAYLDDPHAIPYLRRAVGNEQDADLRADLEQVLVQLEASRPWSSS